MTLDCSAPDFVVQSNNPLWEGETLYGLYERAHTPWEWHPEIFARARELGILALSTSFDEWAVQKLESIGAPAHKIASFENNHLPLLQYVAQTGKPVVMSTGMTDENDLDEAVSTLRAAGCRDLILLKCTSSYPASASDSHVRTVPALAQRYGCLAGLSDHTLGVGAAIAAVALGACLIEKHFVLDRSAGGVDAAFSLEPEELKLLVCESRRAWEALGEARFEIGEKERGNRDYKRSIYVAQDVRAGEVFDERNLRIVRPGKGLAPKEFEKVVGRKAARDANKGTPLSWDLVD
jgi:N-acetylneuraminate synthase